MRLFVAIDPPPTAVQHLRQSVDTSTPGLRWANPDQWHFTLTFCGEVDERTRKQLAERLGRAAGRHAPMRLRLSGAGAFSRPRRAHAVWIGVAGDAEALGKLADSTNAAARRSGIAIEERRFRAHLTVARATPPTDVRELVAELAPYEGPEWTATQVHLVRSHLGPPTVHERIDTWPLGRA